MMLDNISMKTGCLVLNPLVLEEDYLPDKLPGRESLIFEEVVVHLIPAARKQKPRHLWLHGPQGAGKTATARFILDKFEKETAVRSVYLNCMRHKTLPSVMEAIMDELRGTSDLGCIGILGAATGNFNLNLEGFRKYLGGKSFIVILDEIDAPSARDMNAILYHLSGIRNLGIISIASSRAALLKLNQKVESRLSLKTIAFPAYTDAEIVNILIPRAEIALAPESWNEGILTLISSFSNGDARVAIKSLRAASQAAEYEGSRVIEQHHVQNDTSAARSWKRRYQLKGLTFHHVLIYDLIQKHDNVLSADLWQAYLSECDKLGKRPVRERTFAKYRRKMLDMQIISSERVLGQRGNVYSFSIC